MVHFLAYQITNYLYKQNIIQRDFPIYQYGMELAISSIIGIVLVFIAGILFADIWSSLLFASFFLLLRSYTGGLHFNTYLKCNLGMLTIFLICILVQINSDLPIVVFSLNILSIVSIIVFTKYAPIEHANKPIEESDKRKFKKLSVILSISYYILAVFLLFIKLTYFAVIYYVIIITAVLLIMSIRKGETYE